MNTHTYPLKTYFKRILFSASLKYLQFSFALLLFSFATLRTNANVKHSNFDTLYPVCPVKIKSDTTICVSSPAITLTSNILGKKAFPGTWVLLINGSSINQATFNIKPFGYNAQKGWLYSVKGRTITKFDLRTNSITTIPALNWPGDYTEFTYDFTNDRILLWRAGKDSVYGIPSSGGAWSFVGKGSRDNSSFFASSFWNPITKRPSFYGGYGLFTQHNWIYENIGTQWIQQLADDNTCNPPRGGNILAANADGTKLYLFSGQGSCSGNELDNVCTLGNGWGTANGMFCWLKDLWELDLTTYKFKNILPVNDPSILYEGALSYDYKKGIFYLFGGYVPDEDYTQNLALFNTNRIFKFNPATDPGFTEIIGSNNQPMAPISPNVSNGFSYYDSTANRIIWARPDGIWAYYPDSVVFPQPRQMLWSTGDTTSAINVSPNTTTKYWFMYSDGITTCSDTATVTVNTVRSKLPPIANVCLGDSIVLNAGKDFTSYQWNTSATDSSITVATAGSYYVTVKDTLCSATDTVTVNFIQPITNILAKASIDSLCINSADSLYIVNPLATLNYNWYTVGNSQTIGTGNYTIVNNLNSSQTYVAVAQTNPAVCPTKSSTVTITLLDTLTTAVISPDLISASEIRFKWNSVPGAIGYLISTDDTHYFPPSDSARALTETFKDLQPLQTVKLFVKALTIHSCQTSSTAVASATTLNPFGNGVYIPNSFTPNNDGKNDYFKPYGNTFSLVKMKIFNTWGQLIYSNDNDINGWDGTYLSKLQPQGIYYYVITVQFKDNSSNDFKGSVLLLQ